MSESHTIRTHFIDTSALVKFFVYEEGSVNVRTYLGEQGVVAVTAITLAETLGVLKMKWLRAELNQEEYLAASEELIVSVHNETIQIDDSVSISTAETFASAESLCKKYQLDLADALQLVVMKCGFFADLTGDSQAIMVTADSGLATAARNEGLRVWNCLESTLPEC